MAIETDVVAVVVVGGGVAVVLWRRRLAARALPSIAETWQRKAVELVVAGLLQLDDRRAASR
jgi:hypothetical protein